MALFQADSMPAYNGEDLSGTVKKLYNYAIDLTDQLAWLLSNLDADNLPALEGMQQQLTDAQGNLSEISQSTAGILTRVEDAEGNLSNLTQTAQGLQTRVTTAEGSLSTLTQTAEGLSTRVQSTESSVSTLTQTAEGLSTRVQGAESSLSTLTQTAQGLSSRVQGTETTLQGHTSSISTLTQKSNQVSLSVSNLSDDLDDVADDVNAIIVGNKGITIRARDIEFDGNGKSLGININDSGALYADTSDYVILRADGHLNLKGGNSLGILTDDSDVSIMSGRNVESWSDGNTEIEAGDHIKLTAYDGNIYIKAAGGGTVNIYSNGVWKTF